MTEAQSISIHALLAESDARGQHPNWRECRFLSTLSLRRATVILRVIRLPYAFLSTLSLRRATRYSGLFDSFDVISIHALLAESDCFFCVKLLLQLIFLSTLSLRRATNPGGRAPSPPRHFYPRSPCGERRITTTIICTAWRFLSTLSLRRATKLVKTNTRKHPISIHALLAESDL